MADERARSLRTFMTDAERRLWSHLRRRGISGHRFRRQRPIGPYIVDFVCLERKLIVEVDGGQHADQARRDRARTKFLAREGFRVIRFWNSEVLQETVAVVAAIEAVLAETPPPHPSPAPGAGEGEA